MNVDEFLTETVCGTDEPSLKLLKAMLFDQYIKLSFLDIEAVDALVLSEKLSDFFTMVGLKTFLTFDNLVMAYMEGLDSIVGPRIAKTGKAGTPRARKYYDRFAGLRYSRDITVEDFFDYSRIMLCLYQSIIDNGMTTIEDFEYSILSLDVVQIIESMLTEGSRGLFSPFASKRFDTKEAYEKGSCIIVMTMIMLITIAVVEFEEEDDHE